MVYLLWCGEKMLSGNELTPQEHERFVACRNESIRMAKIMFRVKDEEFAYIQGQPFRDS